jgi:CheY-like chemotaxis protein
MPKQDFVILVAEDNPDDALFLRRAFRANKIQKPIHIVPDGEEAIAYLEGKGKYGDRISFPRPGFLILDLKMPCKSGLEVLEWLRIHPEFQVVPTLMLSSSEDPKDIEAAYRLGANAFMVKPSSPQTFERMAKVIHEFWAIAQRLNPDHG